MKKILLRLCYFTPITVHAFYFVFYNWPLFLPGFLLYLSIMLLFIGLIKCTVAGFNGRMDLAARFGIAILIFFWVPFYVGPLYLRLVPLFLGSATLATAFITPTNMVLHKLRILYFIPAVVFIFVIFVSYEELLNMAIYFYAMYHNYNSLPPGLPKFGSFSSFLIWALLSHHISVMFGIAIITVVGLNNIYSNTPPPPGSQDSQGL